MRRNKGNTRVNGAAARGLWIFLATLMVLTSMLGTSVLGTSEGGSDSGDKSSTAAKKDYESTNFSEGTYGYYEKENADKAAYTGEDIIIKGNDYTDTNIDIVAYPQGFEGKMDVVYFKEQSKAQEETSKEMGDDSENGVELTDEDPAYLTYKVNIPVSGKYNISFLYYPVEGRGAAIERQFIIDGELPFKESGYVSFSRVWADAPTIEGGLFDTDKAGNEVRTTQVEAPEWRTEYLNDSKGYYYEPFEYYFEAGEHEIKIASVKEPMILAEMVFSAPAAMPSYADVLASYQANGYKETSGVSVKIEAETPYRKSDSSLYAIHNRSSVLNSSAGSENGKFTYGHTQLNVLGGERWEYPGQWVTWKFTVPESGLYKISLRGKQNINRGMYSCRSLKIDGEMPFAEATAFAFMYSGDFEITTLSSTEGEPYLFYFEGGREYEITFEATLGTVEELARRVDASLTTLTAVYRRFLMLIGNEPDVYRDYNFQTYMPEEVAELANQADILEQIANDLFDLAGETTQEQTMILRIVKRLRKMSRRTITIAENFNGFKNDLGSIGKWILAMNKQPYLLDYVLISSPDAKMPKSTPGFFTSVGHEVRLFASSFTNDYSVAGGEDVSKEVITVWFGTGATSVTGLGTGREQVTLLKQMIDDTFTGTYDIPVNLRFISMGALLPATLAGKGPDVALSIGASDAVNYAMRGAAADLTQFDDYEEVTQRYFSSALVAYKYLDGAYALPETQTFPIMFYRTDIMNELGLDLPNTWADVYDIIPELQNNYMDIGVSATIDTYTMMIYQRGSKLYRGEGQNLGIATNLDSPEAIDAFITFVDLYRSYNLPLSFDFQNRFRRGEMPLAIVDFTTYNVLSIAAPEIRGLWAFNLVPGLERTDEDGNTYVDRSVPTSGVGSIILSKSKNKEAAWEFIKWWTSDETQSRYAIELEAIIGTASRYASANKNVMYKQAWSNSEYRILTAQRTWAQGVPEVPGGYYTTRHMNNAFKRVATGVMDARETLLDYIDDINQELTNKREEMGLPTLNDVSDY